MGQETPCSSPSMPSPYAITSPGLFSILHIVCLGLLQYCSIAWEFGALSWMSTVKWIAANCSLWLTTTMTDGCSLILELTWNLWGLRLFSAPKAVLQHTNYQLRRAGIIDAFWKVIVAICTIWSTTYTLTLQLFPQPFFDTWLQESNFIGATSVWQERKILFTAQKLHLIMVLDYPLRNFQFLADIVILQNWW